MASSGTGPGRNKTTAARGLGPASPDYLAAPVPLARIDAAGRLLQVNHCFAQLLGYGDAASLLGTVSRLADCLAEPDAFARIQANLAIGEASQAEPVRLRHRDGSVVPAFLDARPGDAAPDGAASRRAGSADLALRPAAADDDVVHPLARKQADLEKRLRERECLSAVNDALQSRPITIPEAMRAVAAAIPAGWQFPDRAVARITVTGETPAATPGYAPTGPSLTRAITVDGGPMGDIEVRYPSGAPAGAATWLDDEATLLTMIADKLGDFLKTRVTNAELDEQRDMVTLAHRLARLGYWTYDVYRDVGTWSEGVCAIHGEPPGTQVELDQGLAYFAPSYQPSIRNAIETCIAKGEGADLELELDRADGQRIWVRWIAEPAFDGNGRVVALKGAFQDIDRLKRSEEALRVSREEFRTIFEQAAIGVALVNVHTGRYLRVNNRFTELLGRSRASLEGALTYRDVTHPDDIGLTEQRARQLIGGEIREFTIEKRYIRPDGETFWAKVTVSSSGHPDVGTHRQITLIEDISERKAAEAELRQARDEAERANQAKTIFLAHMSHELRTPLNAILGYADIMDQELFGQIENPRYRAYIRDIQRSGANLRDLLSDILSLARVESGHIQLRPARVALAGLIEEVVAVMGPDYRERLAVADQAAPEIVTDAGLLRHALVNLVGNALKYSGTAPVHIATWHIGETCQAVIRVEDSGPGIAEADLARVTEPFFRGTHATHSAGTAPGSGVGLAVTKRFVERLGGTLTIASAEDAGTRADITLPERPPEGEDSGMDG